MIFPVAISSSGTGLLDTIQESLQHISWDWETTFRHLYHSESAGKSPLLKASAADVELRTIISRCGRPFRPLTTGMAASLTEPTESQIIQCNKNIVRTRPSHFWALPAQKTL
jgi:hypothetical protein